MIKVRPARLLNTLLYSLVLLGGVLILLSVLSFMLNGNWATDMSIETPSRLRTSTDRLVERLQERLERGPTTPREYIRLGGAYLQKARETGDVSYYSRAENAFQRALELEPENAAAMTRMGAVALGTHQFQEALVWAERSLEFSPGNADAYGVLGDAQIELGRYEDAIESYQTMVDLKPDLGSYARVANIRKLMGDQDGAIEAMQMAVSAGNPAAESTAWAWVQLGNLYFDKGHIDEAASHYETALRAFDGYYIALAGLGKARTAQGRFDEAIDLYERSVDIVPQPATLAALGDLYAITGDESRARLQYETVEIVAKLSEINGQVYNRDIAIFYADHDLNLDEALAFATRELEVRKDIYGYDALAWALYKNNRPGEASEIMTEATKLGTQDASLYYHAGMIYYGLGQWEQSGTNLERALELNPHFSILQADRARRTLDEIELKMASKITAEGAVR